MLSIFQEGFVWILQLFRCHASCCNNYLLFFFRWILYLNAKHLYTGFCVDSAAFRCQASASDCIAEPYCWWNIVCETLWDDTNNFVKSDLSWKGFLTWLNCRPTHREMVCWKEDSCLENAGNGKVLQPHLLPLEYRV